MPPRLKTRSSTPKLSEAARHMVIPEGIATTGWPRVEAKAKQLGIGFDPWQQGAHTITLGKRADGKYAATVGGIVWSIPRQVGKTYAVGGLLITLCVLHPNTKVVWTAHHSRTSTSAFRSMRGMCRRKGVAPHLGINERGKPSIRQSNGEQEIEFRNGSIIQFGARSQGFGRGFDSIDFEVFDEAQILDEKALEDMVAATNQTRHPHGALIFYMGTPPRPGDPSEAFALKRAKALRGTSKDTVYIETSADPDADLDDHTQWRKANPSFPHRTPLESMLRLRENLATDDAWKREALGIWDEVGATHVFGPGAWEACAVPKMPPEPAIDAIALASGVDRDQASIGACTVVDGVAKIGAVDRRDGVGWIVPEAKRIQDERNCAVVIAGTGPTSDLIPALESAGVRLTIARGNDVADAFATIFDAVREKRLQHPDHPYLNAAVAGAKKRKREDRYVWDRRNSAHDVSMLEAVTLALWGAAVAPSYNILDSVLL